MAASSEGLDADRQSGYPHYGLTSRSAAFERCIEKKIFFSIHLSHVTATPSTVAVQGGTSETTPELLLPPTMKLVSVRPVVAAGHPRRDRIGTAWERPAIATEISVSRTWIGSSHWDHASKTQSRKPLFSESMTTFSTRILSDPICQGRKLNASRAFGPGLLTIASVTTTPHPRVWTTPR